MYNKRGPSVLQSSFPYPNCCGHPWMPLYLQWHGAAFPSGLKFPINSTEISHQFNPHSNQLRSHQSKLTIGCTFPAPLSKVHECGTGPGLPFFTVLRLACIILNTLSLAASIPPNFQGFLAFPYLFNWGKGRDASVSFQWTGYPVFSWKNNTTAGLFFPFLCIRIFCFSSLSLKSSIFLFLLTPITVFWASPIPSSKESNNSFASSSSSPEDEEFTSFSLPACSGASSSLLLLLFALPSLCKGMKQCGGTAKLLQHPF